MQNTQTKLFKKYAKKFCRNQRVVAKCSDGESFRGKITDIDLQYNLTILFDDGDQCKVRAKDVRNILNEVTLIRKGPKTGQEKIENSKQSWNSESGFCEEC